MYIFLTQAISNNISFPHFSSPPDDPDSILTYSTIARLRVLGHHTGGDGDARSARVWFLSFLFMSKLVISCVELNGVKQKYLREITKCFFDCLLSFQ